VKRPEAKAKSKLDFTGTVLENAVADETFESLLRRAELRNDFFERLDDACGKLMPDCCKRQLVQDIINFGTGKYFPDAVPKKSRSAEKALKKFAGKARFLADSFKHDEAVRSLKGKSKSDKLAIKLKDIARLAEISAGIKAEERNALQRMHRNTPVLDLLLAQFTKYFLATGVALTRGMHEGKTKGAFSDYLTYLFACMSDEKYELPNMSESFVRRGYVIAKDIRNRKETDK
jgi:hypothetical protein